MDPETAASPSSCPRPPRARACLVNKLSCSVPVAAALLGVSSGKGISCRMKGDVQDVITSNYCKRGETFPCWKRISPLPRTQWDRLLCPRSYSQTRVICCRVSRSWRIRVQSAFQSKHTLLGQGWGRASAWIKLHPGDRRHSHGIRAVFTRAPLVFEKGRGRV